MIDRLIASIIKTEAPIVVGLDPQPKFIPEFILNQSIEEFGETLEAMGDAIFKYNKGIADSIFDLVPAVKPQIAMYEQFGIPGLVAYKKTVDYCRKKGLIVIGDVKRGDIGSTSESYAIAHLGKIEFAGKKFKVFDEDFATVNPYLGSDGILPFTKVCKEEDRGIFVLVKTSNPSSGEFQDREFVRKNAPGVYETLSEAVASKVEEWGSSLRGEYGYSDVGAVVGATYPKQGEVLRKLMPHTFILVPGYGAQGGKGSDLVHFFDKDRLGAIVNSSRGIIAAYTQEKYSKFGEKGYADAARAAVLDMKGDIARALDAR